jgi:bifunctional non-homologous end joining protein LigD
VVALDDRGRPSFQRLQARMHLTQAADVERARAGTPVTGVFFDALALDGRDLRALPLEARKACLALVVPARGVIHYGEHVLEHGEAFYEAASEQRIEGIVAKRVSSRYTGGRTAEWLKIKCQLRQEFVIGGFTAPQGARARFGALHVGVYDGERLTYVGRVGTGFDEATLDALWHRLQPLRRPTSPFARGTPTGRGHAWVEPVLVCEVRFTEWTAEGGFRHPAFLGLRADTPPTACRRETPAAVEASAAEPPPAPAPPPSAGLDDRDVRLSNLGKVFWPEERYTKGDLIAYYDTIAPRLLPYLRDRPLVLTRFPDGIAGKSFYQKDAPPFTPSWLRTARIDAPDAGRAIDYLVVDDAASLRYVINLGAIPLHLWGSRVPSLERPDWLILDLDPKGAPFTDVVRVARALRRILDDLAVAAVVKTSGATGLHILIPLGARYTWEETRTFARLLATLGVDAEPRIATMARPLRAREGKVYIDWLQNVQGQTIVAPFSVRPLPGAPVSCPLRWDEVTARLDPRRFTMATVPARFATMEDPVAPVLREHVDIAAALGRLERRVSVRGRRQRG